MDNIKIEDIDKLVAANPFIYLWKRRNSVFALGNFIFLCIVIFVCLVWIIYAVFFQPDHIIVAIYSSIFIFFCSLAVGLIELQRGIVQEFMKRFSDIKGLSYRDMGSVEEIQGPSLKTMQKIENIRAVIEGAMGYTKLKMFVCHYRTAFSGRDFTVCEIKCNAKLPRIFLSAKNSNLLRYSVNNLFDRKSEHIINLEGDFNKYFLLYVPKEYEIEVLQMLTPEIMVSIIEYSKKFDIEFFDDGFSIYSHNLIKTGKELKGLFDFAELLANKLVPRLGKIKFMSMR